MIKKRNLVILAVSSSLLLVSTLSASCFSDYMADLRACPKACREESDVAKCEANCRALAEKEYERCSNAGA